MNVDNVPELRSVWDEARGHIERGEYDKAIDIYKYVLIRYADNETAVEYANAYLGDVFLTTRRLSLAERHLKKAIACASDDPHYHYLLGFTYSVMEQWAKSVRQFRDAIGLEPDNGEYERGLGWAMFSGGDKGEGVAHLHRALALSPSNIHTLTDLATAMLVLGNTEKAREYGEKALQLDSGYILAQRLLETIDRIERKRS